MNILVLNGPNLNLLGKREPDIYGKDTLEGLQMSLEKKYNDIKLSFFQSNHEGELIDRLHKCDFDGVVFNPAAYTHTSIALLDAINGIDKPVIEVHISNIHSREDFRKQSITSAGCIGQISGFGLNSYSLGIQALIDYLN